MSDSVNSNVFYNDNDPNSALWLRSLIDADMIHKGIVDDRSIADIKPSELAGFEQCHFFAGIGGWSYALELADWPRGREIWTGSCPCQPFSVAGNRRGIEDERHLWPAFRWLIAQQRPATVVGEQVSSSDGREWLAGVFDDLEAMGYVCAGADLPACSVGSPQERQRLFWVANSYIAGRSQRALQRRIRETAESKNAGQATEPGGRLVYSHGARRQQGQSAAEAARYGSSPQPASNAGGMDRTSSIRCDGRGEGWAESDRRLPAVRRCENGFWEFADYLYCTDDKWRPVEPGTFPLANGIPKRVAQLRGLGNAIVPQVAAEFLTCILELQCQSA